MPTTARTCLHSQKERTPFHVHSNHRRHHRRTNEHKKAAIYTKMNEMSTIDPTVSRQQTRSLSSFSINTSTNSAPSVPRHLHLQQQSLLPSYFGQMNEICPDSIQAYSRCVINRNESSGSLVQRSCEHEFSAIKKCFVRVRRL